MNTAIAKPSSSLPSAGEWTTIREQALTLLKSGFLPAAIKTPEQAIAIAIKGRELGIPMMQAFSHIHIIQGKPTISSELMLSLIYRNVPGAQISYEKNSNHECVIVAARGRGQPQSRFSFSMDDAANAGVLNKDNWKKFPSAMLRARCISAMARAVFPDAILGCSYVPEELGADIDDEGRVVAVPPESEVEPKDITPRLAAPLYEDPREYVIDWGKEFKGKTLDEVGPERLSGLLAWAEGVSAGKRIPDYMARFIKHAKDYLTEMNDNRKM